MNVTKDMLKAFGARKEGIDSFDRKFPKGASFSEIVAIAKDETHADYLDFALWVATRLMNRGNRIRYSVFAGRLVLRIFEERFPDDKRPRLALDAAEKCISDTSDAAAAAASAYAAAADAATVVAYATYASSAAVADLAADLAAASAYAAAATAAYSCAAAAYCYAAYSAATAATAAALADRECNMKCLDYAETLIEKEETK